MLPGTVRASTDESGQPLCMFNSTVQYRQYTDFMVCCRHHMLALTQLRTGNSWVIILAILGNIARREKVQQRASFIPVKMKGMVGTRLSKLKYKMGFHFYLYLAGASDGFGQI